MKYSLKNRIGISMIAGSLLVVALISMPILAVGPGFAHPITKFTDFNQDGKIDIEMSTGNILINDGNNKYLSNEIVFKNGIPMQRTYTLSNSTIVPTESFNTYIDLSYMTFSQTGDRESIIIITPSNGTAMIFVEDPNGDFYPTKFISLKNQVDKNLIMNLNNQELVRRF